ncbi:MAG: shikimate dehydrogenase [Gammaproteobacteria bacterium]|nr:shikimate dehydrogenase [Gammaproteobacteria bacterium]MBU2479005.1 shikimate dehydrogenase [Gammaproteobacteria bacterium]
MNEQQTTLDRYAVMGNPIGHSKSPQIHTQFATQTNQSLIYQALLVELGDFPAAVAAFHAAGGKGLNITVPFKQEAWQLAQIRTPRAERAGAVNTLWWNESGQLSGDTTDGVGLVHDLRNNHGLSLAGQRILLLGAGGAARGVVESLLAEQPHELVIANRTATKATELAALFHPLGPVSSCDFDALDTRQFDLVINATAAGLSGTVPPIPSTVFANKAWAYDMMYATEPTAFVRWALQAGAAQARDGLGMLVEQAAEAFWIWRGVRPATGPVIELLRKS